MGYVYEIERLEYRQRGRILAGSFPYAKFATVSDRGRRRKESIAPRAFRYAVDDDLHEIDRLRGHDFDSPLGSKQSGTLDLDDTVEGLSFEARLPTEARQPTWMRDTVLAVRSGLIRGISPGFRVPPTSAVSNAETLIPEPGSPGVFIRQINRGRPVRAFPSHPPVLCRVQRRYTLCGPCRAYSRRTWSVITDGSKQSCNWPLRCVKVTALPSLSSLCLGSSRGCMASGRQPLICLRRMLRYPSRTKQSFGMRPISTTTPSGTSGDRYAAAWRNSGAGALVAGWVIRRVAGSVVAVPA